MIQVSTRSYLVSMIVLASAVFAGCSSSTDHSAEPNRTGTVSPTNNAVSSSAALAPATIRVFTEYNTAWPPKKDWGVWKWVKEETNITVNQKTATSPESLSLEVASGSMPDVMSVFPGDVQKFGAQGAFLDLSKYMDKMANVKAYLDAKPDIRARVTQPDGKIYNIINDGAGTGNQLVWFYRDDVFQKNNLKAPSTWDELYLTAKKLKELYPESYPLVFRHGINTLFAFAPTFGVYPEFHKDPVTGKMKYGVNDPNFKKMIGYLNKFYTEGLFPPDWLSMDYKAWSQFMATNKSFITVQYIGQIEIMNNQMKEGHLKFMAPPLGAGSKAFLPRGNYEDYGFAVASKTTNLDASLRYLNFIYSQKGRDVLSWGKEGETYTVENGKRKFKPIFKEANDLRKEAGIQTAGTYGWFDFDAWLSLVKDSEQEAYVEAQKYQFPVNNMLPILTKEEIDSIVTQADQLNKYYTTSVSKFIMGETPLAQWDTFISSLNQYGLPKLLETYQTALERQKAGK
ncbi:sugar ABC transporter permease [Paenibacillus marchantiophytorum]|uniref:Sugar ABC transporter permease n=1 Tax=Paenibacillus marchantiophytorum TaxID=1619310 RepID=A0ABQ2BPP0_9BACL|nr:extracellular solute-binding protein [Paenibacillus marchantiophytorum]GGI44669.1 sugar ABC transporter permease [Paenibacillus marchantiophytorum]